MLDSNPIPAPAPFFPLPSNRVWRTYLGGRTLDEIERKPEPADSHLAEDWIASTTRAVNPGERDADEGLSPLDAETGGTLLELLEAEPTAMLGPRHAAEHGHTIGVLTKLLDSGMRLHLQAHPERAFSREHLGVDAGKAECYVVLGLREGQASGWVYLGFQHPPTEAEFVRAVEAQDMIAMLGWFERVPVAPGDVLFVPGGLPHAIGPGVFLIEVMEPTDLTVRFEFGREGLVLPEESRFMGRDAAFAASLMRFDAMDEAALTRECRPTPRRLGGSDDPADAGFLHTSLVDEAITDRFAVQRLTVAPGATCRVAAGSLWVGVVAEGGGTISAAGRDRELMRTDRWLVPYATEATALTAGAAGLVVVVVLPPGSGPVACTADELATG